jgi:predicted aminopeptidase
MTVRLIAFGLMLFAGGCANIGYYLQSVRGQLDIWQRERAIEAVIRDPETPAGLREKLERVVQIRDFASRELKLPDNPSYRRYADLGRPYVVWNVFAAEEFSVEPRKWCFLFAGCVAYRGYFDRAAAEDFAADLARQGYDVYVAGVPAYSTLGWFADPVLSTFIRFPESEVARLIFHELAHQVVYVRDDSVFNESFAVAVEIEGVRRWLGSTGDERGKTEFRKVQQRRADFVALIQDYRAKLDALYRMPIAPEAMRARKAALFAELEREYARLKAAWGGFTGYDDWFAAKPNNAQIASVAIYTRQVPAFQALLEREGGDLERFYAAVRKLAALDREERDRRLRELAALQR